MPAKTPVKTPRRQTSRPVPSRAHLSLSMMKQNLANMITVAAVSGAVLLGFLAAKRFQLFTTPLNVTKTILPKPILRNCL
jgi:hypothetical protein